MFAQVFNFLGLRWIVGIAVVSIACYLIPEAIFLLKHRKNNSGLEPDKCIQANHYVESQFNYSTWGFKVSAKFVSNSPKSCLCPDFPAIKLESTNKINAWIQVVETDSSDDKLSWFIDSHTPDSPFYNSLHTMSDSPHWGGFGYFYRFSTYFKARAYPTVINEDQSIEIFPPVEWGFKSVYLRLSLQGIIPSRIIDYGIINQDIEKIKQIYPNTEFKIAHLNGRH